MTDKLTGPAAAANEIIDAYNLEALTETIEAIILKHCPQDKPVESESKKSYVSEIDKPYVEEIAERIIDSIVCSSPVFPYNPIPSGLTYHDAKLNVIHFIKKLKPAEDKAVRKLSSEAILNNLALVESLRKIAQWEKIPPSNLTGGLYRNSDWCQGQLRDVVEVAQAALAYYEKVNK